ncbi:MAG TPA: hypothetical protein VHZ55_00160 [Bryobacteraceae bacterium]|nr:hypothetical protein [Bryobacteraceae bacterium]
MAQLDEVKSKYRTALEAMPQQGVQVTHVGMQDDKLYVLAFAPTQEAKNAVWNQVKAIDSTYSDLTLDIRVGSPETELNSAPPQTLATGLAAAFKSDQTPSFGNMLSGLFGQSDPQQKAGLLNSILGSAGPGLLASALPGPLANILKSGGSISPEQAQQIPAESLQNLADHAQKANPSIIDTVSGFYSQHPKVVQALGAGALAMVMSHMKKS